MAKRLKAPLEERVDKLEVAVSELGKKVEDPAWVKQQFASLGGKSKSEAKARAARENGKKGWPLPKGAGK